jgi:hypothetical protein
MAWTGNTTRVGDEKLECHTPENFNIAHWLFGVSLFQILGKGKVHPITGHAGPEGGIIPLFL